MRNALLLVLWLLLPLGCGDDPANDARPAAATLPAPTPAEPVTPPPSDFLRFRRLDDENGLVETAVVTYADPEGRHVSLVAAVHIADAAHYRALDALFGSFDRVLYELIADPGVRPSPDEPASSGLSSVQRLIAGGFELVFQLDGVNYRRANFVHADLTPAEFSRLQDERQESFAQLAIRSMQAAMQNRVGASGEGVDLVSAFRAGYGRHALRMWFATQIQDLERIAAGLGGADGESVLLEGRNARAMEVLGQTLAAGHRNVAIYYGAAHMPDFERRLLRLGFEKIGQRWLVAWDCHKRKDPRPR